MKLAKTHLSLTVEQSLQLDDMLYQLYNASNRPRGFSSFHVETLFQLIREGVFLCVRNQTKYGVQGLFESVSNDIQTHNMETITVSSFAQQNGVNENRLFFVFQKYVGMGPGDYLCTYRLTQAGDLLVASTLWCNCRANRLSGCAVLCSEGVGTLLCKGWMALLCHRIFDSFKTE